MFGIKMNSTLKNASTTSTSISTSPRSGSIKSNHSSKTTSRQQQKATQRRVHQCYSCQRPCLRTDRSLIRALGQVYHYDCFTCNYCQALVAEKFYALNTSGDSSSFKIVCEEHYHAQVGGGGGDGDGDGLCQKCGQHMGTVNAFDKTDERSANTNPQLCQQCQNPYKCPGCSQQPLNSDEACYEFENQIYCLQHFSDIKEIQCSGCQQAVLEKFVEHKLLPGKKWHPECYMIFKFWDVRLADTLHPETGDTNMTTLQLKIHQSAMERKVNRIWVDLSSFEESSATCISDMLLLMAAGAYMEGFRMASQFAMHLVVLYKALDHIQQQLINNGNVLSCKRESKIVCDQVIQFFYLLAQSDDKKSDTSKDNNRGATQELLTLVTSLAQNFKTLIRIGLKGALRLEHDRYSSKAILEFLNNLLELERKRVWVGGRYWFKEDPFPDLLKSASKHNNTKLHQDILWDRCYSCQKPIEDDFYQYDGEYKWHPTCFVCSQCQNVFINLTTVQFAAKSPSGSHLLLCNQCSSITNHHHTTHSSFTHMTQLQNYLYILKLALARLYLAMNSSVPHIDKHLAIGDQQIYNSATLSSSAVISTLTNNFCHNQSLPQQQQKPLRRRSVLGSINFGIIKRVKAADLDLSTNYHIENGNTSTSTKTSINESKDAYHHQDFTMENFLTLSTSQQLQNDDSNTILSRRSHPTTSTSTSASESDGHGLFSVTRRSSTNTRPKRRHSVGKKHTSDPGSRYNEIKQKASSSQSVSRASINTSPIPTTSAKQANLYEHLLLLAPDQYLLVNYIAAKSIHALLPDLYMPDKWMTLVDLQKPTLWGKLKTRIRTSQAPSPEYHTPPKVFGGPLSHMTSSNHHRDHQQPKHQVLDLQRYIMSINSINPKPYGKRTQSTTQEIITCFKSIHCKVPVFIQHCLLALLQRDPTVEGIFRKNGNIRELKQLEIAIDNDLSDDNSTMIELLSMQSPIQLAALLKRYLYKLPEPLLTYRLYPVFVAAAELETEDLRKSALHLACCMLPKENRDTMQVIFQFLHHISTFKDANKMDIQNLARIIAPSVLHNRTTTGNAHHLRLQASTSITSASETTTAAANDINIIADRIPNKEIDVVKKLIKYQAQFGKTPDEMLPVVSDHQLVEWLTSVDSKHFLRYYDNSVRQRLTTSSRSRRINHSTGTSA